MLLNEIQNEITVTWKFLNSAVTEIVLGKCTRNGHMPIIPILSWEFSNVNDCGPLHGVVNLLNSGLCSTGSVQ